MKMIKRITAVIGTAAAVALCAYIPMSAERLQQEKPIIIEEEEVPVRAEYLAAEHSNSPKTGSIVNYHNHMELYDEKIK